MIRLMQPTDTWRTDRFTESETLGGNKVMPVRRPMLLTIVVKITLSPFFIQKESGSDFKLTASAISKHHGKADAASSSHNAGNNIPLFSCFDDRIC